MNTHNVNPNNEPTLDAGDTFDYDFATGTFTKVLPVGSEPAQGAYLVVDGGGYLYTKNNPYLTFFSTADLKWKKIEDGTNTLESGRYTIGALTAAKTISAHSLEDNESAKIVDIDGVFDTFPLTLDLGGSISFIGGDGKPATETMPFTLSQAGDDYTLIRRGNDWQLDDDAAISQPAGSSWATSGEKHEGSHGGFFADGPHSIPFTFVNKGDGDKLLVVKTVASYDGVVDVLVGTTAGADDLGNIDDITPGNIGSRLTLKDLVDGQTYHVTITADADADTEAIEWCVVDPFYLQDIPDNSSHANSYARIFPQGEPFDLTTWENPSDLTLVLVLADGPSTVIYGNFTNPQTLEIPDLKTGFFKLEGDGWFPVAEESSEFYRELSSWNINGTNTRIHLPELQGNVEVVAVEDTEAGANRYIWKDTDLPIDGPRYAHFRVRLDPANTTSMMFRAARPSNPSELIVDLATGETFVDQNGAAPVPVVMRKHVTPDFGEYLVQFPKLDGATLWQLYPAAGPNGITNRNGYDAASIGKVYLEFLDTNASPMPTGNPLYDWFFENYSILATDRGSIVPYAGIEGMGVEFVDASGDNYVVIGDPFEINQPTFKASFDIRKETSGNSFYVDLRDVNNELNRHVFNPTTGASQFTGTGGGTATVKDNVDRWHVEIEFNVPLQGEHRVDIVSDWVSGGGNVGSTVLYDYRLFALDSLVDAPVDENYIDIGNKRMQWGVVEGAGLRTVILPEPFADDQYVVVPGSGFAGGAANRIASFDQDSRTTTQFDVTALTTTGADSAAPIFWTAVGLKP